MYCVNKVNGKSRTHIDKDSILLSILIYRQLLLGVYKKDRELLNCNIFPRVAFWVFVILFLRE